jgi:hypothetical protein
VCVQSQIDPGCRDIQVYCSHIFCLIFKRCQSPGYYWYHCCFYIPHALYFYTVEYLYCRIIWPSVFIKFLSPAIVTSVNMHVPFPLSQIMMSGLLLWMVGRLHWLIPHYVYRTVITCFYRFKYMNVPVILL